MNRRANSSQQWEALRDEITHTRAELGETVQALAAKADVRARVRASATHAADRVRTVGYSPVPWLLLAGGATVVLLVLVARGRRR